MRNRIGIIIQARLSSTRLPKKIILDVGNSESFLDIQLKRLKNLTGDLPIILATSTSKKDVLLREYSIKYGISFFQGSEENVLERFIQCSEAHNLDAIIRICSDNPFIDIKSIKELCSIYNNEDYLSFKINNKPAILTHYGFFCEIVSLSALRKVYKKEKKECLEHVTNCIYSNTNDFNVKFLDKKIENSSVRCTLDTNGDFENLKKIYFDFVKENHQSGYKDIIKYIESNLELLKSMSKIIKENTK